jgi:tRNA A-37 threonylcarbamoyl transferase component Bud32
MAVLIAGTELDGCRIEEMIGRGGMGVVYRARQLDLDRDVAIKVITPERIEDERTRARFLSEARAAAAVEHPNVLPVYGAGVAEGQAYLVMRYVPGDDLRALVRRDGALSAERAADVAVALGDALDAIHRAGYIHRDVKPANVLLDVNGHVYLSDFGLAKQVLASAGLTESDRWVGTLDFAAPEQIRGGRVDARADVYALGGVLHFMLTGAVPFDRDSDEAKMWAHLAAEPTPPSVLRPGLPVALDGVVRRALAKQPDDRQPSAGDLGRAARAAVGGATAGPERIVARGAAAPGAGSPAIGLLEGSRTLSAPRTAAARRRRRGVAAAAGVALGVGILLIARDSGGNRQGGEKRTTRAASASSPSAETGPRVGETIRSVGFRPRGIAIANGDLWVISALRPRLARIDAATLRRHGTQARIGRGAVSVTAHGSSVWVVASRRRKVLQLDAESGNVVRRLAVPVPPILAAAGANGLWVVGHGAGDDPDVLYHYDLDGRRLGQAKLEQDATALAVGGGRAWVTFVGLPRLFGFDAGLHVRSKAWLTAQGAELAYGAGRLWISVPADDSIARFDPRDKLVVTTVAGRRPEGLAVAGGRVFVASNTDHTVVMLDPKTGRPIGEPLAVPPNPWAVAAGEGHVWVSGLGANTVTRIDY